VPLSAEAREAAIADIGDLPWRMRDAVAGLSEPQVDTPYRPGGWTVRQLVHHVADSHMHAYLRFKLALTADTPRIAPYDERAWALLADSRLPVQISLDLLGPLHARWAALYRSVAAPDLAARGFFHPERNGVVTLEAQLQTYAWHSRHHVAHITRLREREGW
jgi:hypothetical protein